MSPPPFTTSIHHLHSPLPFTISIHHLHSPPFTTSIHHLHSPPHFPILCHHLYFHHLYFHHPISSRIAVCRSWGTGACMLTRTSVSPSSNCFPSWTHCVKSWCSQTHVPLRARPPQPPSRADPCPGLSLLLLAKSAPVLQMQLQQHPA